MFPASEGRGSTSGAHALDVQGALSWQMLAGGSYHRAGHQPDVEPATGRQHAPDGGAAPAARAAEGSTWLSTFSQQSLQPSTHHTSSGSLHLVASPRPLNHASPPPALASRDHDHSSSQVQWPPTATAPAASPFSATGQDVVVGHVTMPWFPGLQLKPHPSGAEDDDEDYGGGGGGALQRAPTGSLGRVATSTRDVLMLVNASLPPTSSHMTGEAPFGPASPPLSPVLLTKQHWRPRHEGTEDNEDDESWHALASSGSGGRSHWQDHWRAQHWTSMGSGRSEDWLMALAYAADEVSAASEPESLLSRPWNSGSRPPPLTLDVGGVGGGEEEEDQEDGMPLPPAKTTRTGSRRSVASMGGMQSERWPSDGSAAGVGAGVVQVATGTSCSSLTTTATTSTRSPSGSNGDRKGATAIGADPGAALVDVAGAQVRGKPSSRISSGGPSPPTQQQEEVDEGSAGAAPLQAQRALPPLGPSNKNLEALLAAHHELSDPQHNDGATAMDRSASLPELQLGNAAGIGGVGASASASAITLRAASLVVTSSSDCLGGSARGWTARWAPAGAAASAAAGLKPLGGSVSGYLLPNSAGAKVLVAKVITRSDAQTRRVILPRIHVETNWPEVMHQGHFLFTAVDAHGVVWDLTLRAWSNGHNPKPVYVLERLSQFVRLYNIKENDVVGLCRMEDGTFLVEVNSSRLLAVVRGGGALALAAPPVLQAGEAGSSPSGMPLLLPAGAMDAGAVAAGGWAPQKCQRTLACNKPAGHAGWCIGHTGFKRKATAQPLSPKQPSTADPAATSPPASPLGVYTPNANPSKPHGTAAKQESAAKSAAAPTSAAAPAPGRTTAAASGPADPAGGSKRTCTSASATAEAMLLDAALTTPPPPHLLSFPSAFAAPAQVAALQDAFSPPRSMLNAMISKRVDADLAAVLAHGRAPRDTPPTPTQQQQRHLPSQDLAVAW